MNIYKERLALLREEMKKNGVHATIIPGTDPHISEYLAKHWQERNWIAGFTGSAGTAVVTLDKAALWTDSRYFIQSENQLAGTSFSLMKDRMPDTPDIISWLKSELREGEKLGLNPQMFTHQQFTSYQKSLSNKNISIQSVDLMDVIWTDRPALPNNLVEIYEEKYAGKSAQEKLKDVRAEMQKVDANIYVIASLDEIAWLLNIRGSDVNFNPLVISYAVVENNSVNLFIDEQKLDNKAKEYLDSIGVWVKPYSSITDFLSQLDAQSKVLFDSTRLNQSLYEALPSTAKVIETLSPITLLKSIKNEIEIEGIRQAMIKDGVALTQFFIWLENNIDKSITEYTVGEELLKYRARQDLAKGPSFGTICGYAANGAMNHYSAKKDTAALLGRDALVLIDSGGQYLDGTTDITRTMKFGEPTEKERKDYTLVLKGMIALSYAKFPHNTRGSQLDVLARQFLWQNNLNFGHGTGHGVGHYLCVHEGPQNIRTDENPTVLQEGMIVSNEPGMYRDGEYGIRIENLILVRETEKTSFGIFYEFETLTLFPIDTNLIDRTLFTDSEKEWLNNYHQMVYERLSPNLNHDEKKWLKEKCKTL